MKLVLITNGYPFEGETFICSEAPYLAEYFEEVIVIPLHQPKGKEAWEMPSNFRVIEQAGLRQVIEKIPPLPQKIKHLLTLLSFSFSELRYLSRILPITKFLITNLHYIDLIEKQLEEIVSEYDLEDALFYSYWMTGTITALGKLKQRGIIKGKIISRAHGGDLYHERAFGTFQVFKTQEFKALSKLFAISEMGKDYLASHYPDFKNKIEVSRLGVSAAKGLNPMPEGDTLEIVSCGYLRPGKRFHKIAEALMDYTGDVHWVLFGNGSEMARIKKMIGLLPSNAKVDLRGYCSMEEISAHYKSNPVDLLVSVSESEGIPVSMMEAMAYGIPVLSTDVGGCAEIVLPESGILIPADFNKTQLLGAINQYFLLTQDQKKKLRTHAFEVWKSRFNAELNYKRFAENLLKLAEA